MVGDTPVAAHMGAIDVDHVSLGVIAHSPFAAANSPGKLILRLLGCKLEDQGYEVFDLTPGGQYKITIREQHRLRSIDLVLSISMEQAARICAAKLDLGCQDGWSSCWVGLAPATR